MLLPEYILFAQHGWADTNWAIATLADSVASPQAVVIAPDLGFINTWLRIQPLVAKVEEIAQAALAQYPQVPIRIMGHSMGGLIWLEVLDRHPEWWQQVESLALIASPVGGADWGRMLDPLNFGIGIARDLGANRRAIAEKIAAEIPTLIVAGDIDGGSDGTITVGSTQFVNAKYICLPGLSHVAMKNHPQVAAVISKFWAKTLWAESLTLKADLASSIIRRLQAVKGMTDAHRRDFYRSHVKLSFKNGITIRIWHNPLGVEHIFVADSRGECLYGGFVGWIDAAGLRQVLAAIEQEYCQEIERPAS